MRPDHTHLKQRIESLYFRWLVKHGSYLKQLHWLYGQGTPGGRYYAVWYRQGPYMLGILRVKDGYEAIVINRSLKRGVMPQLVSDNEYEVRGVFTGSSTFQLGNAEILFACVRAVTKRQARKTCKAWWQHLKQAGDVIYRRPVYKGLPWS